MKPSSYMMLGLFVLAASYAGHIIAPIITFVTLAFAGGALFGKGYGLWEARTEDQER